MSNNSWICPCGHYEESDFHCSVCGNQPPWGCDCSTCHDRALENEEPEYDGWEDPIDQFYKDHNEIEYDE